MENNQNSENSTAITIRQLLQNDGLFLFLGVGSDLHSDDEVGLFVVRRLQQLANQTEQQSKQILRPALFWEGGTAPENLSGAIRQENPAHVLLIDAADLNLPPGSIKIVPHSEIGGITFSTHALPLSLLADYLEQSCFCQVTLIGIQPVSVEFGGKLSTVVRQAALNLVDEIISCLFA